MGLLAAELDRQGIASVCLQFLELVARAVGPPRALCVPWPHGWPLGPPEDRVTQRATLLRALELFSRRGEGRPILEHIENLPAGSPG